MRTTLYIPDDLAGELRRRQRQERRSASAILRDALSSYLYERRRRDAGEALAQAAREHRLAVEQAREATEALARDRRDDPHRV